MVTPKKQTKWYINCSRAIVEHKSVVALTTILTIYALAGDDIRLICTNKDADPVFNIIVIVCIVVFTLEVILSCLGKDDYFMGFFFMLDVVATATLFLDLTFVADELAGGGEDDDNVSSLRGGRTARLGAKAGRVVRVIRLVRILKLYKAVYEARARKKELEERKRQGHSDDDEWEDEDVEPGHAGSGNAESRVGKNYRR